MAVNGKAKGNSFERDIAEKLSLWLTGQKEKRAAWRSDTSGGAATIWSKKKQEERYVKANAGDIRQIMEKGVYPSLDSFFELFTVETKHYKKVEFYPPLNKITLSLFESAHNNAEVSGKEPILIMKQNNKKILWFTTKKIKDMNFSILIPYKTRDYYGYLLDEVLSSDPVKSL